jgi:colanic acid/amylovoran biosynthesis glycosyltransferase
MSDAPRVVLVCDRFPTSSETFIAQRFARLLDRGWDVHVWCNESTRSERAMFSELGGLWGRVHRRPKVRRRVLALAAMPFIAAWCLVRAPVGTVRYLVCGWRRRGSEILRTLYYDHPLIRLQPDLIHFTFGWFAPRREYLGRALGAKLVVSFQGADLNYGGLEQDPGYYEQTWKDAAAIHFLSHDLRNRGLARGYQPDGRDLVVIPGIDLAAFAPHERTRDPNEPLRILSVGRLHWKKGYDVALLAISMLEREGIDLRYRIIGDGPLREAVLYHRHDLGLTEHVELLGSLPAARVREEMQWADVLLHAATSEGFCYAAVEAQAMCLPVVTSDADGLTENVEDGTSGFVVGRRDAAALAEAVAKLAADGALRKRMGDAGRSRAIERFDVDREISGFEALYRRALDASP